jgi:hypothetical protein
MQLGGSISENIYQQAGWSSKELKTSLFFPAPTAGSRKVTLE